MKPHTLEIGGGGSLLHREVTSSGSSSLVSSLVASLGPETTDHAVHPDLKATTFDDDLPSAFKATDKTPVLFGIMLANTIVFAAMIGTAGLKALVIPSGSVLLQFGASSGAATIVDGQFWRILSYSFVHAGILHIVMNFYLLYSLGELVEKIFGSRKFAIIYFVSAIGGALTSLILNPGLISVGCSGAIYGLMGALAAIFWCHRSEFPRRFLKVYGSIVAVLIGYGLISGFVSKTTDNAAHIGGLIFGLGSALSLMPWRLGLRKFDRRDVVATVGCFVYCLALFAIDYRVVSSNKVALADGAASLGAELMKANQPKDALRHLSIAAALAPNEPEIRWDRARVLVELNDLDRAMADATVGIKLRPKNPVAYSIRGLVWYHKGDAKHAIEDYDKAVSLNDKHAMTYNQRAWCKDAIGDYAGAIADCTFALKLERTEKQKACYLDTRAVAYLMLNQLDKAAADLDQAAKLDPNDGAIVYHRACVYAKAGQLDKAKQLLARSPKPYNAESWEPKVE